MDAMRTGLSDLAIKRLFIAPTLLLLIAMNVFPLLWSLYLSFTDYDALNPGSSPRWVGGANYGRVLGEPEFWGYFVQTAGFVAACVGTEFILGFGLALLLMRIPRGRGLLVALLLIPAMLSSSVMGTYFKFLLEPNLGVVNTLLMNLGVLDPPDWKGPSGGWWGVYILDVWQWTPFVMLIALAGLSSVPTWLYEAAAIDRAGWWFRFRRITLPLAAPLLLLALLFRAMDCFKLFDSVVAMLGSTHAVQTVSIAIRNEAFARNQTGVSCALAYVQLVVVTALAIVCIRALDRAAARR